MIRLIQICIVSLALGSIGCSYYSPLGPTHTKIYKSGDAKKITRQTLNQNDLGYITAAVNVLAEFIISPRKPGEDLDAAEGIVQINAKLRNGWPGLITHPDVPHGDPLEEMWMQRTYGYFYGLLRGIHHARPEVALVEATFDAIRPPDSDTESLRHWRYYKAQFMEE